MPRIDLALVPPGQLGMRDHLLLAVPDRDPAAGDGDPDRFADQPPGHAVGVGVDLDTAIGLDAPDQVADMERADGRRAA